MQSSPEKDKARGKTKQKHKLFSETETEEALCKRITNKYYLVKRCGHLVWDAE